MGCCCGTSDHILLVEEEDASGAPGGSARRYDAYLKQAVASLARTRQSAQIAEEDLKVKPSGYVPVEGMSDALLGPWEELDLRNGCSRGSDGILYVTCRTKMVTGQGKMISWWFAWCDETAKFRLWHPADHVQCSMKPLATWERQDENVRIRRTSWEASGLEQPADRRLMGYWVGRTLSVGEFTGKDFQGPGRNLDVTFRSPLDFGFTKEACEAAGIRALIAGHFSMDRGGCVGRALAGHLCYVVKDNRSGDGTTLPGVEICSNYWLGDTGHCCAAFSDTDGVFLLRHCYEEMRVLVEILPGIFQKEASNYWKDLHGNFM